MLKGFKEFLLRGNVIDLAVAVVIGGSPDFSAAGFVVNGSKIIIGSTINALINFLIVAAAVYFFVVLPVNKLMERRKQGLEPEPDAVPEDVILLQQIRDLLAARNGQV